MNRLHSYIFLYKKIWAWAQLGFNIYLYLQNFGKTLQNFSDEEAVQGNSENQTSSVEWANVQTGWHCHLPDVFSTSPKNKLILSFKDNMISSNSIKVFVLIGWGTKLVKSLPCQPKDLNSILRADISMPGMLFSHGSLLSKFWWLWEVIFTEEVSRLILALFFQVLCPECVISSLNLWNTIITRLPRYAHWHNSGTFNLGARYSFLVGLTAQSVWGNQFLVLWIQPITTR